MQRAGNRPAFGRPVKVTIEDHLSKIEKLQKELVELRKVMFKDRNNYGQYKEQEIHLMYRIFREKVRLKEKFNVLTDVDYVRSIIKDYEYEKIYLLLDKPVDMEQHVKRIEGAGDYMVVVLTKT